MDNNPILVDWFAMTFRRKNVTPQTIIDFLALKVPNVEFRDFPGRYHYRRRLSFGHIDILFDSIKPESDFPMLELSGQGCREFETFSARSFDDLFRRARDTENYHLCRLDVAYDDFLGILPMERIVDDFYKRNYVSTSKCGTITNSMRRNINAFSIQTGSRSSDMYLRIYDKARERGYTDGRHWVRAELVLKQERAIAFVQNNEKLGTKFKSVLKNYIRFVDPSGDTNYRRWETTDYWNDFLGDVQGISLFSKKDIEYNFSRLQSYVLKQAGNSIDTYIQSVGLVRFLDDLMNRDSKLTSKQRYVIKQARALFERGEPITEAVLKRIEDEFNSQ